MIYVEIRGERVPSLGFGTWQLRGAACRDGVADALEIGYRHIDTAQMYENEEEVGTAIRNAGIPRQDLFLTTKIMRDRLAPDDVRRSTEESLRKLQTDYVDLLLIHWPNSSIPLEETLDAMLALMGEGKARHIGVSNFTPELFRRAADHAPVFCNQVEYHPMLSQDAVLDLVRARDAMLTAYAPLARGKVTKNETLRDIGEMHGKSPAQIALRWLIQQPNVAAIPKASSPEHRRGNFDIFDFELSTEEMNLISDLGSQNDRLVSPGWAPWRENSVVGRLKGMLTGSR